GSIPEREPEKRLPHPRKAAARKLPNPDTGVVTINTDTGSFGLVIGMSQFKPLNENNWRASLVPAPR
ncbi:hypothetical protein EJ07DRAFT_148316, partial [Lizonia empirigonia]